MLINNQSSITLLSHLRHELRTPINVIIGYSEMLIEDLEIANDSANLDELQQIRECGIELVFLIKTLLSDKKLEFYKLDLERLLAEQNVQFQIKKTITSVIKYCQQISKNTNIPDSLSYIKQINQAAQNLLDITDDMAGIATN